VKFKVLNQNTFACTKYSFWTSLFIEQDFFIVENFNCVNASFMQEKKQCRIEKNQLELAKMLFIS